MIGVHDAKLTVVVASMPPLVNVATLSVMLIEISPVAVPSNVITPFVFVTVNVFVGGADVITLGDGTGTDTVVIGGGTAAAIAGASTATFDVANDAAANTAETFSLTVGTVTVTDVDVSAATTLVELAAAMQTALRSADSDAENISVTVDGATIVVTDATDRAISSWVS